MKVIYYADDGTGFETEEECLAYENLQNVKIKKLLNKIHAFDENGKKITVGDGISERSIEGMVLETIYVTFDSEDALIFFDEQLKYSGNRQIHEDTSCKVGDVYIYDDYADEWESAMEMVEYYQGIIDKFTTERK